MICFKINFNTSKIIFKKWIINMIDIINELCYKEYMVNKSIEAEVKI